MGNGTSSHVKPIKTTEKTSIQNEVVDIGADPSSTPPTGKTKSNSGQSDSGGRVIDRGDERKALPVSTLIEVMAGSDQHAPENPGSYNPMSKGHKTAQENDKNIFREQVEALQQQVADLESQNLDLGEQIQILEEQMEELHANEIKEKKLECSSTVAAKDRYIHKLESETKLVQDEIAKLKARYKKKIRSMNSQISEAKHESSLHVFEMKGEIQRLQEDNAELIDKIKQFGASEAGDPLRASSRMEVEATSGRTNLILELSTRVSEQENKIFELEFKINERDKLIEKLRCTKRTGSGKGQRSGSAKMQGSVHSYGSASNDLEQDVWPDDTEEISQEGVNNVMNKFSGSSFCKDGLGSTRKIKKKNCLKERAKGIKFAQPLADADITENPSIASRDSGFDSVPCNKHQNLSSTHRWMSSRSKYDKAYGDLYDNGLELESVLGNTPGPSASSRSGRPVSPVSEGSRWSDEDPTHEKDITTDVKSIISQSSIRRISAPKKKKKHAMFDSDALMDKLLGEIDAPLHVNSVSQFINTDNIAMSTIPLSSH